MDDKQMQNRLMEILTGLVACPSVSCTPEEDSACQYIYAFLKDIPYFHQHPDQIGVEAIPNDPYGRRIPYAFIRGRKRETVILTGHFDVVSTEVYGEAEPYCFDIRGPLEEKLKTMDLPEKAAEDMQSGEWIWGRGAADMKGGISLGMVLVERFAALAAEGKLEGSLLFIPVPDEESYSTGMRHAVPIMNRLRRDFDLTFRLLIDLEPSHDDGGRQTFGIGTVGKTMPAILTQGYLAHTGYVFEGISALRMLNGLYEETSGNQEFVDTYKGEASMPPSWLVMRDLKEHYDVSLPYRAAGYISVLSYTMTVDRILDRIKEIGKEVFRREVFKLNHQYQMYRKSNTAMIKDGLSYQEQVLTVRELSDRLRRKDESRFASFYAQSQKEAEEKIASGMSLPDATVWMMNRLLDFSDIRTPVILIGMAPPFYPPTHSDRIAGREGYGTRLFDHVSSIHERDFDQPLVGVEYVGGISDNSYTSLPPLAYDAIAAEYPLWGKVYSIDFDAVRELNVPAVEYGPIGRDVHQWTERLNKRSFLEVSPAVVTEMIRWAWENA